jgi:uncharacterized damage-inducible protein DinB
MEPFVINKSTLTELYRHMEWADAVVWASVLASEDAQTDAKLQEYFYHLHLVQRAFLRVWRGEPRDTPFPTFNDAPSLMLWGHSYYNEAFGELEGLTDQKISEPMALPWSSMVEKRLGRAPGPTTIGETALQVTLHSMYHRGQINARLRVIGVDPPLVDYIAWIWLGRPAADWPSGGSEEPGR